MSNDFDWAPWGAQSSLLLKNAKFYEGNILKRQQVSSGACCFIIKRRFNVYSQEFQRTISVTHYNIIHLLNVRILGVKSSVMKFCEKRKRLKSQRFQPFFGPSDWSRTSGLLNPIQARYQTALHPVICAAHQQLSYNNTGILKMQEFF